MRENIITSMVTVEDRGATFLYCATTDGRLLQYAPHSDEWKTMAPIPDAEQSEPTDSEPTAQSETQSG